MPSATTASTSNTPANPYSQHLAALKTSPHYLQVSGLANTNQDVAEKLAEATNTLGAILVSMDQGALIASLSRFYVFLSQNFHGKFGSIANCLKAALETPIVLEGKNKIGPLAKITRAYNNQLNESQPNPKEKPWLNKPLFQTLDGDALQLTLTGEFDKRLNILEYQPKPSKNLVETTINTGLEYGSLQKFVSAKSTDDYPEYYQHLELRPISDEEVHAKFGNKVVLDKNVALFYGNQDQAALALQTQRKSKKTKPKTQTKNPNQQQPK